MQPGNWKRGNWVASGEKGVSMQAVIVVFFLFCSGGVAVVLTLILQYWFESTRDFFFAFNIFAEWVKR